jgi:hypothetical protein
MCKLTVRVRADADFHRTARGKTPEFVNLRDSQGAQHA